MLAFVHIHKTAGTTLNWILRSSYGIHHLDVEPWDELSPHYSAADYQSLKRWAPRVDSIAGHKIRAYGDLHKARPDIRYYTFVREPVARLASLYQHGVQKNDLKQSLEEWLEGRHNGQTIRIAGEDNANTAIKMLENNFFFVGDVKHFEESLVVLQSRVQDSRFKIVLQSRNVASNNRQKNTILQNKRQVELIQEHTINDRLVYEYVSNELYPRQRKEYGDTLSNDLTHLQNAQAQSGINLALLSSFVYRRLFYRPLLHAVRLTHGAH